MKILNILLITSALLITACQSRNKKDYMHPLPPVKENIDGISVHNIGTLCYRRSKPKELEAIYFPHNSTCVSSSAFEHDYTMQIEPQGAELNIKIEGGYRSKHSQIALADCAGAGIKRVKTKLASNAPITIKWNGNKLGVLPSQVGKIYCFKRASGKIVKDNKLKAYINDLAKN